MPAVASAGVVSISGTDVVYTARGNEVNDVRVKTDPAVPGSVLVQDLAGATAGSANCLDLGITGTLVRCQLPGQNFTRLLVTLADENDRLLFSSAIPVDSTEIEGNAGIDVIDGSLGRDIVHGGTGDDEIDGTAGNDSVHGDAGDDDVRGSSGDDYVEGDVPGLVGGGNDFLSGGADDDTLVGGNAADTLVGGPGRDDLDGNTGNDRLDSRDLAAGDSNDCGEHLFDTDKALVNIGDTVFSNCEQVTFF